MLPGSAPWRRRGRRRYPRRRHLAASRARGTTTTIAAGAPVALGLVLQPGRPPDIERLAVLRLRHVVGLHASRTEFIGRQCALPCHLRDDLHRHEPLSRIGQRDGHGTRFKVNDPG